MKKNIAGIILASLVIGGVFAPTKSAFACGSPEPHYGVPVTSTEESFKDTGIWCVFSLDALAFVVKEIVLQTVVKEINNWAATGFEGNPVFLENPDRFLQDAEDIATGAFIEELSATYLKDITGGDSQFFCRGLAPPIIFDLGGYGRPSGLNRFRCTLSRLEQNLERYSDDFAYGGWNTLFRLQQGSNNPYSFYANALEESDRRRQENNNTFSRGANSTGGFLPQVKCSKRVNKENPENDPGFVGPPDPNKEGLCSQYTITSPASAVSDYIKSGIESGVGNIIPADELSEILTSVLTSLIKGAVVNLSGR